MTKYSIVIPVYNVANFIEETLDSVLLAVQNLRKIYPEVDGEVICVDDGSTDGSGEILDEYARRSTSTPLTYTFHVIHQVNAGVSIARNAGLDTAKGEYILFADGDDLIHPQTLVLLTQILSDNPVDCVRYDYTRADPCRAGWADLSGCNSRTFSLEDNAQLQAAMRFAFGGGVCSACYRCSVLANVRFETLRHNEDHVFNAAVFGKFKTIAKLDRALYYYRVRKGSATNIVGDVQYEDILKALRRIYEHSLSWPFCGNVRKRVYTYIWREFAGYAHLVVCGTPEPRRSVRKAKYIQALRSLYREKDFAPNVLTKGFRLMTLRLGPLTWPVGVNLLMHRVLMLKGWIYRAVCKIYGIVRRRSG